MYKWMRDDYPAEYRKNIEEIFPMDYDTGFIKERNSIG